jgi:hypothetical protein
MRFLLPVALVACSNDVDPRVVPGGGIGDGEIDGEVNVHVIDDQTDEPIANATVTVGETAKTTDARGLVVFSDVEGRQTISVKMEGYRSTVWVGANGANVTIPVKPQVAAPASASLSGTIAGWSSISVGNGHAKAAFVVYSQSTTFGDAENNLSTPDNANICFADPCNWTVVTRTGSVTLVAVIVDRDLKGTPLNFDDDTNTVIGYASKAGITVSSGVNQSGLVLDPIEAGNLETVTMDLGTPPAGLPEVSAFPGIDVSESETVQLPLWILTEELSLLVPKRTAFGPDATYRLTGIAQTTSGADGAQSFVLRQGLTTMALQAGEWLTTPVNVEVTRTIASWEAVDRATIHSVAWRDETHELLEISVFDGVSNEVEVPSAVALPSSGTLTAKVQALGVDFDLNDFSLKDDFDQLWGVSAQPVSIP